MKDWGREDLWLNPPFSMMDRVVDKLRDDNAHAILVMPDWPYMKWHKPAMDMAVGSLIFSKGSRVFQLNGTLSGATKWDTRIVRVCLHTPRCTPDHVLPQGEVVKIKKLKFEPNPTKIPKTL